MAVADENFEKISKIFSAGEDNNLKKHEEILEGVFLICR
jgi:hypothetical protein